MKLLITVNESKSEKQYAIPLYKGVLTTDVYKTATNKLMENIQVTLNGVEIKPQRRTMPRFRYQVININDPSLIPVEVLNNAKLHGFKNAVDAYNSKIKQSVEHYIAERQKYVTNLDVRNAFYEDIMLVALEQKVKAYSPCLKTIYEATAKKRFQDAIAGPKATEQEIEIAKFYGPRFGLELPSLRYYYASRRTVKYQDGQEVYSHGYTQEIELLPNKGYRPNTSGTDRNFEALFHPSVIPEQWQTKEIDATSAQWKELYNQVAFFRNLPESEQKQFIALGYEHCEVCKNIARKIDNGTAVECEFCGNIFDDYSITTNNHLLYGTDIDLEYSSFDDIQEYLNNGEQEQDYEHM